MDRADVGLVVIEKADQPELRHEVRGELLMPLAQQTALEPAVAGIDVASDANREQLMEPGVDARATPAHQEIPLTVAQHEVRNDLLVRGIVFHLRSRLHAASGSDPVEGRCQTLGPNSAPAFVDKD